MTVHRTSPFHVRGSRCQLAGTAKESCAVSHRPNPPLLLLFLPPLSLPQAVNLMRPRSEPRTPVITTPNSSLSLKFFSEGRQRNVGYRLRRVNLAEGVTREKLIETRHGVLSRMAYHSQSSVLRNRDCAPRTCHDNIDPPSLRSWTHSIGPSMSGSQDTATSHN